MTQTFDLRRCLPHIQRKALNSTISVTNSPVLQISLTFTAANKMKKALDLKSSSSNSRRVLGRPGSGLWKPKRAIMAMGELIRIQMGISLNTEAMEILTINLSETPGTTSAPNVTSRLGFHHILGPLHYLSTILFALGPNHALTILFLGTHTRTSQWVTHYGNALARYSLNFEVPMEPEASELPKSLMLGKDENIHIRITPLGHVGFYSRNTVKKHVLRMSEDEKIRLRDWLNAIEGRICFTSNLWSLAATDGYLTLTAHFVDKEWKMHKRILNFCHMPPPHTGVALSEKLKALLVEWGIEKKLFSITLDNASANDCSVKLLNKTIKF
ncbi:hypothetical protein D8674_041250 [Pyrus ussuriensis x Pyrus communis]|uniref:Uncharacterized protein n=1 Tax=Pyrus ussuriensis x Pyrus communis TaxID=2448454 RepID=A0A5N5GVU8_9ROSA|nr:hypothetical protein D8674_041250 [Pyrus ussuriensis x Pyrus communis]